MALLPDVLLYSMHSNAFTQVCLNQYMSFVNVFDNIWKDFLLSCKMNLLRGKAREKYNIEVRKTSLLYVRRICSFHSECHESKG